jgi:hypothetical protein
MHFTDPVGGPLVKVWLARDSGGPTVHITPHIILAYIIPLSFSFPLHAGGMFHFKMDHVGYSIELPAGGGAAGLRLRPQRVAWCRRRRRVSVRAHHDGAGCHRRQSALNQLLSPILDLLTSGASAQANGVGWGIRHPRRIRDSILKLCDLPSDINDSQVGWL